MRSQASVAATNASLHTTSSSHMIAHLRTIDLALNKAKDFVLAFLEAETRIVLALIPFKCLNVQ